MTREPCPYCRTGLANTTDHIELGDGAKGVGIAVEQGHGMFAL